MNIKKILVMIVGLFLIVLAIFSNKNINAKFITAAELNDVVDLIVNVDCNKDMGEVKELYIPSSFSDSLTFKVSNTSQRGLYYGVYYKVISPATLPTNVSIGQVRVTATDVLLTSGLIASNGTAISVPIAVINNSNTDIMVQIGILVSEQEIIYNSDEHYINSIISYQKPVDVSKVSAPELLAGMIPVTYNESSLKWVKANNSDVYTQNWYDYQNKKWANAVVVKKDGVDEYSCPDGWTLSGTNCTKAATSGYTCTGIGGTLNTTNNRCYKASTSGYTCTGIGGTLNTTNNRCYKAATNGYVCTTAGDTLNASDNTCYYKIKTANCATLNGTTTCTGITPPAGGFSCKTGYTQTNYDDSGNGGHKGLLCSKAATQEYSCDTNWTLSGTQCYIAAASTNTCDTGWTLSGTQCYKAATTSYTCPTGSTRSGTTCTMAATQNEEPGKSRDYYMNASAGTEILESDILAYYVWIPRYRYRLFNVSFAATSPQTIDVVFENKTSSISNGTQNGEYLSHPAFWWDKDSDGLRENGEELAGIWVGKFETTGNVNTPTILPNVGSIRSKNISTQFSVAQSFETETYFNVGNGVQINSHMMKNMEWGATAYLSHSKYGKNSEIAINESETYLTGEGDYKANTDQSTTDNIYGIYDMSGNAYEYMMGVMEDNTNTNTPMSGNSTAYNSGFTGKVYADGSFTQYSGTAFPDKKYYDLYDYGTTDTDDAAYNRSHLGDATGETRSWYNDVFRNVYSNNPWVFRGGRNTQGLYAGSFYSSNYYGSANQLMAFRCVLANIK